MNHRLAHQPPQCLAVCPRRTGAVADRERFLQYVEEPGLSLRAQLRAWTAQPVGGVCHVDDVGILGRPGPTTLLSAVSGGVEEAQSASAPVCGRGCVLCFGISALGRCVNSTRRFCTTLPNRCRCPGWTPRNARAAIATATARSGRTVSRPTFDTFRRRFPAQDRTWLGKLPLFLPARVILRSTYTRQLH